MDFRFSYLQPSRWIKEVKNNFEAEKAEAIVSTYAAVRHTQMRVWNTMTGPSYRFSKRLSIRSFNFLVGLGNQPIKTIAADVKTRGTNELVTWDVAEIKDLTNIQIYKNTFIGSSGLKYTFCVHSEWGVSASCDVISSQREVSYFVTRTVQHTGEISEYTVRVTHPGFSITPGIGLVRHF